MKTNSGYKYEHNGHCHGYYTVKSRSDFVLKKEKYIKELNSNDNEIIVELGDYKEYGGMKAY